MDIKIINITFNIIEKFLNTFQILLGNLENTLINTFENNYNLNYKFLIIIILTIIIIIKINNKLKIIFKTKFQKNNIIKNLLYKIDLIKFKKINRKEDKSEYFNFPQQKKPFNKNDEIFPKKDKPGCFPIPEIKKPFRGCFPIPEIKKPFRGCFPIPEIKKPFRGCFPIPEIKKPFRGSFPIPKENLLPQIFSISSNDLIKKILKAIKDKNDPEKQYKKLKDLEKNLEKKIQELQNNEKEIKKKIQELEHNKNNSKELKEYKKKEIEIKKLLNKYSKELEQIKIEINNFLNLEKAIIKLKQIREAIKNLNRNLRVFKTQGSVYSIEEYENYIKKLEENLEELLKIEKQALNEYEILRPKTLIESTPVQIALIILGILLVLAEIYHKPEDDR